MDYNKYFEDQAGRGVPEYPVFRGARHMRGHGFLGRIAGKLAVPLWKFLGKHLVKAGMNVADDVISKKRHWKESMKENAKNYGRQAFTEALPVVKEKLFTKQSGTGLVVHPFRQPSVYDVYKPSAKRPKMITDSKKTRPKTRRSKKPSKRQSKNKKSVTRQKPKRQVKKSRLPIFPIFN